MNKLIFVVVLVLLASTNPDKSNYIEYTKQQILGHNPSGIVSMFADPLIDRTTTEKDLCIATIYTTYYGERKVTTLGMFNRFIPLK